MNKKLSLYLILLLFPTLCAADTGLYIGAGVGANVLTGNQNTAFHGLDDQLYPFNYGLKDNAPSGEIFAGWGHFWGPYYLGAEALYSFLNSSSEFSSIFGGRLQETVRTKLKNAYGAAARIGYQLQNNILLYMRVGWESRRISIDLNDPNNNFVPLNQGYRSNAFVPGLGMEIKCYNNLFFRLELRSAFHPYKNINVTRSGGYYTRVNTKPKLHTLLIGLTYRF